MRVLWQTFFLAVVFLKQNLVCGPLIQCYLLRNKYLNVFDGGATSALHETLGRLSYRVTDRMYAKQLLQRLENVWNLVLLSVTVEATCFANVSSFARCVTRLDVSLTCHAVFEKTAGKVA